MANTKAYSLLAALLLFACGTPTSKSDKEQRTEDTPTIEAGTRRMPRVVENFQQITNVEEYQYAVEHYWDGFDFDIGERVIEYDTTDICQALATYVYLIEPQQASKRLKSLMHRAERSRHTLDFFATITEMVLNDPNSPLRNDEYYIPILEVLSASPLLDEYDKLIPQHDLHIAKQNRIGRSANDFEFTLADGNSMKLYDIDSEYTLLMFANPDCPMCRAIIDDIESSVILTEFVEMERLTVVAIYTDSDIAAWKRYLPSLPKSWIKGYDNQSISHDKLYNLRAIPALYLLDNKKLVLIKDGTSIEHIEYIISL